MENTRFWEPVVNQLIHPSPVEIVPLAASMECPSPAFGDLVPERHECSKIGRHRVVVEVAANDLPQPFSLLGNRLVHAPPHLLFDPPQLRPHAVAPGLPFELEFTLAGFAADEGEAEKVEGLWFTEPSLLAVFRRKMPSVTAEAPRRRRHFGSTLGDRLAACKLVLHPVKTKIVYCKDVNRRGDFPVISFDFLGFQFRARKTMWRKGEKRIFAHSFQPAASPKALTRISREVRSWTLHQRSDKSLIELARMYNPCIRGWINYYSHFYKTQLRPTLKRIDAYVIRWARRKFKRMVHQTKGAKRLVRPAPPGERRRSSPIGHYAMATAEHREPCESRGSRTVLGAPGGESPPGNSS